MISKFIYLYLAGGTVALLLLIYQVTTTSPNIKWNAVLIYMIPTILLYYMAYKTYHVKKDGELM